MRMFWRAVARALEDGRPVELVSVLAASGSAPRGAGAMMAVFPDGGCQGTIGGGAVEHAAQQTAAALLTQGEDALRDYVFRPGDAAELGMVCGGEVTVLFQHLAPAGSAAAVSRGLCQASGGDRDVWLVRRVEGGRVTDMGLADRTGARWLASPLPAGLLEDRAVYRGGWSAIPVVRAGRTYVFGGGHVAQALVPVLAAASFRPVVYDDRPEFADPARFPAAEAVLCGPFTAIGERVRIGPADSVVVMTRGHQADYEVLEQVLRSGARYLGCIGSRRKLDACRERLLSAGFTPAEYARLHAPIGLDIGAEGPAEIAVAVAAEMIAVRAGKLP